MSGARHRNNAGDTLSAVDWRERAQKAWNDPASRETSRESHVARAGQRAVVQIEPERLTQLRRLMSDNVSLDRACHELNSARCLDAPQATVEALMFSLREGVAAFERRETLRRLSELSNEQVLEIATRVQRFKPEIAPAWTPEEVQALALIKSKLP
jgi:hypothetical protein